MKHFLYRITNKLNQRFYVGVHSTPNQDDGYLGSGRRIKAEVKKYGKENFEKVILEELPTREALMTREREIVNEDMLQNPLCLNLKNGGEGGGKAWTREQVSKGGRTAIQKLNQIYSRGSDAALKRSQKSGETYKLKLESGNSIHHKTFLGKNHSEDTKAKMRLSQQGLQSGERNSQFGSCWVTNGKAIKIKKEQLDDFLAKGYSRGRKLT